MSVWHRLTFLRVQLTQKCQSSLYPVLDWVVCVEKNCQHKVCGMSGCGQHSLPLAGLVDRTLVSLVGFINLQLLLREKPHHGKSFVQNLGKLFFQRTPSLQREIYLTLVTDSTCKKKINNKTKMRSLLVNASDLHITCSEFSL